MTPWHFVLVFWAIVSDDSSTNPAHGQFTDPFSMRRTRFSKVWMPYCSGDTWTGTTLKNRFGSCFVRCCCPTLRCRGQGSALRTQPCLDLGSRGGVLLFTSHAPTHNHVRLCAGAVHPSKGTWLACTRAATTSFVPFSRTSTRPRPSKLPTRSSCPGDLREASVYSTTLTSSM